MDINDFFTKGFYYNYDYDEYNVDFSNCSYWGGRKPGEERMNDESVRNNVVEILRKYPETRNNDNLLVIRFLLKLDYARKKIDKITIDLLKFEAFPSFESITRVRRDIQNKEKLYLPDKETTEKRIKSEKEYKEKYSKHRAYNYDCGINRNSQYL